MDAHELKTVKKVKFNWSLLWSMPVRIALLLAMSWFIYYEAQLVIPQEADYLEKWSGLLKAHQIEVILCLLLLPVNVIFEAFKWKTAVQSFHKLDLWPAVKSILFGNTLGIFTPAKSGEYAGRLLHLQMRESPPGIMANLYCSLAQNAVNLLIGGICFGLNTNFNTLIDNSLTLGMVTFSMILTLLMLMVYFNLGTLFGFVQEKFQRFFKSFSALGGEILNSHQKVNILSWSMLRYLVYALQYVLICKAFDFDLSIFQLLQGIGVIFLIQSILILPPVMSLIARGETALLVWSVFGVEADKILLASLTLWMINVLIPAIAGTGVYSLHKYRGVKAV